MLIIHIHLFSFFFHLPFRRLKQGGFGRLAQPCLGSAAMVQTRNLNVHEYLAHELMQRVSATIEHLSLSATKISLPPLLRHSFFKKSIQSPLSRARALSSLHPCPSGTSCTALLYMCSVYKFFGLVLCLCPLLSIISLPPLYYKKNIFPIHKPFLFQYEIKTPRGAVASSVQQAVQVAEDLGKPSALSLSI